VQKYFVIASNNQTLIYAGNKRLDLAGPLLAFLYRSLFKNLMKEVRMYTDFNLELAIKTDIITDGLRYPLATGNWGDQKRHIKRVPASLR